MKCLQIIGILLPLALLSCASSGPKVLDTGAAESELTTLYFASGDKRFTPAVIGGSPAGKRLQAARVVGGTVKVTGEYDCVAVKGIQTGPSKTADKAFVRKGVSFEYAFEAGKTYYIESALEGEESLVRIIVVLPGKGAVRLSGPKFTAGVNVYEITGFNKKQEPIVSPRNSLGFVPLDGDVTF
jgi:hypothetical protein